MGLFANVWQRIYNRIVDNRNKLTATGGFLIGVLVTLGLIDFWPDLRQRLRTFRGLDHRTRFPGQADYVRLEDHTRRRSSAPVDGFKNASHSEAADEVAVGIEGLIGNTPLVKLQALSAATGCEIFAKAEFLNGAGNSPKDRVAVSILDYAEAEGLLRPGRGDTVYEGTVGSTGISLASVCRARGYNAHICMPDDQATEKAELLTRLGATVERVRPASIVDVEQFVNVARRRAAEHTADPSRAGNGFFADQFENAANYLAHEATTGPEIFQQTNGQLDIFVAGAGTGGTIAGVARSLKPRLPDLRIVLADPQGSGLYNKVKFGVLFSPTEAEGTRRRHQVDSIVEGVGLNRLTSNFAAGLPLVDDAVRVSDAQAMRMARWLVAHEGLFVGASSAVNCVAAAAVARQAESGTRIVTILCDSGTRHLSKFWKAAGELEGDEMGWDLDDILDTK